MSQLVRWGRCGIDGCPSKGTHDQHVPIGPLQNADTWREPAPTELSAHLRAAAVHLEQAASGVA